MPVRNVPLIKDNVVVNVIVADPEVDVMPAGYFIGPEGGAVGWTWTGNVYVDPNAPSPPPPLPPPPPQE